MGNYCQLCRMNNCDKTIQFTKETECSKEPREVCGPESCPLVQGEQECETETKTVSMRIYLFNDLIANQHYCESSAVM